VNYFNFVLVAGTAGMSLATVIRLEFAYPGVGVLAGDSLQYLSIATAHGVIMVFYMIMPVVFGAFGNFLLPTQLGVHDVAFPRLNSAAFWFLPGGLIMLCQLVCVDRRYQRMNCFNIRELQGILKRRFFTDLVNTSDHRHVLESSMIGLRFKTNNELSLDSDTLSFHNYGTTNSNKQRSSSLLNAYTSQDISAVSGNPATGHFSGESLSQLISLYLGLVYQALQSFNLKSVFSLHPSTTLKSLATTLQQSFNVGYFYGMPVVYTSAGNERSEGSKISYSSNNYDLSESLNSTAYNYIEDSSEYRHNRFSNSIISYDYKCGHYLGI
jgi:hypothetical protein